MHSFSEIRPWAVQPLAATVIPVAGDARVATEPQPDPVAIRDAVAAVWEEGFQNGYRDGLRAAREEQEAATLKLIQLAQQAFLDANEFTRTLEREIVDFSIAIAEKVTESAVKVDRSAVIDVVRAALAELQQATVVRVRVSPSDVDLVASQWEQIQSRTGVHGADLIADDQVEPGGCVIDTATGTADGQLSTKLTQIAQMFGALADGESA